MWARLQDDGCCSPRVWEASFGKQSDRFGALVGLACRLCMEMPPRVTGAHSPATERRLSAPPDAAQLLERLSRRAVDGFGDAVSKEPAAASPVGAQGPPRLCCRAGGLPRCWELRAASCSDSFRSGLQQEPGHCSHLPYAKAPQHQL